MRDRTLNWFSTYLSHRTQFTVINKNHSATKNIVSGVPQGSVLGPVLFLIYINDLYMSVKDQKLSLFADDANVFVVNHDLAMLFEKANEVCFNLFEWFTANKLCVNFCKTSYMIFMPTKHAEEYLLNNNPSVFINNIKINRVKCCRYLGLLIDENLNWNDHIKCLITKVTQLTGIMYKFRDLLSLAHKKNLYYSLIYSSIAYGLELYGQTCDIYLKPLNVALNRALRVILHVPLDTPLRALYLNFNTLPVSLLHHFVVCKLVHRCIYMKNVIPVAIQNIFNSNVNVHHYATRASSGSLLYRYANDGYNNSYSHYACTIWNHLPDNIRNTASLTSFSKLIKFHLLNQFQ